MTLRKFLTRALVGTCFFAAISVSASVGIYADASDTLSLALDSLQGVDWSIDNLMVSAGLTEDPLALVFVGLAFMAIVVKRRS